MATLDFIVRPAATWEDFEAALQLRAAAYARHLLSDGNPEPDDYDVASNAVVLIAQQKKTGRIIGTMRAVLGHKGPIEIFNYLPPGVIDPNRTYAEARRLAVGRRIDTILVKLALWKAFYVLCHSASVEFMIVASREPINADHKMLLFQPAKPGGFWITPEGTTAPHEVLLFSVREAERTWHANSHALYKFVFETAHPDITPHPRGGINPLASLPPTPADPHFAFAPV